jgi:hypothetical protein
LNASTLQFKWLKAYNADYYYYSLFDQANFPIYFDYKTNDAVLNLPNIYLTDSLYDGYYRWGVRGANTLSSSLYSYSYFTIDRTKPTKPTLSSPSTNFSQISGNINFLWQSGSDKNYNYDSLLIFHDSTLVNLSNSFKTTQSTYTDSLTSGTYFWIVTSFDKAGNKSDKSEIRKLTIL